MSVEAIGWAFSVKIKPSSLKFLLVALANNAMAETGLAWPSIDYLANATGMDRKTVVSNLANLRDQGLITDTGKRVGATKQIPVYRLNMPGIGPVPSPSAEPSKEAQKGNSTKGGTVPVLAGNSTEIPLEQYQKRDTEPSGTVTEPSKKKNTRKRDPIPRPDDVADEVWDAFKELRKAKRAPLTALAIAELRREADKAGWTLDRALRQCCKRGWQGFEASWLRDDASQTARQHSPPAGKYAETIAVMTGRSRQSEPETIDVIARERPAAARLG